MKINIDEHIYLWEAALNNKNFKEADRIRDLLDTYGVFCYSTPNGPMVIHRNSGTREDILKDLNAEKRFEGWLKTIKLSPAYQRLSRALLIMAWCVLLLGCTTRKAEIQKESTKLEESNKLERIAPGSQIVFFPPQLTEPKSEPDRPDTRDQNRLTKPPIKKDTIILGDNGATATVSYHADGHIKGFVMNCPDIHEKSESQRTEERQLKLKKTEREFQKSIVWIGVFGIWGLAVIVIVGKKFI